MSDEVETGRGSEPALDTGGAPAGAEVGAPAGGSWRGTSLGRFLALEAVGSGNMGVVLSAYDPRLDRRVAVKLLRPGRRSRETVETARLRLQREAQVMARLAHPNVVTVYDVGEVDDRVYVAMEFVEGRTLREWLGERPRSWNAVVQMFLAAGRGLAAAHAAGVVHRDFKPDNVLVGADGRPRVTDFGLASTASRELPAALDLEAARAELTAADLRRPLTFDGALLGTPAYMAPEQHDGATVDARADQFAFCVALYEALYGERPFKSEGYLGLLVQVKEGRVRSAPRGASVPAWLRKVVVRGLRPRPEDRHPGMEALLRALASDPTATRKRNLGWASAVVAMGLMAYPRIRDRVTAAAPCSQAHERLAGVWDDGVRQRVERAFTAAAGGAGEGKAAYQRVAARIGAYADGWTRMHGDACRATHVRREQSEKLLDARMACLERRRGALAGLTEAFTAADAAVVERSITAVAALAPLRECADAESLLALVPPPPDPAAVQRIEELERKMDRVQAKMQLGEVKQSVDAVAGLVKEADALGYARTQARARWLSSEVHFFLHDMDTAERELMTMSRLTAEARDDKGLVRALVRIALVYQMRNQSGQALAMARAAELAARRAGDEINVGYAQMTGAAALQELGRHQESEALAASAFATLERRVGNDDQSAFISPLVHMASGSYLRGQHRQAHRLYERARAVATATYGPDHLRTIQITRNAAVATQAAGELAEARHTVEGALRALRARLGPRNELLDVQLSLDLATLEERMGDRQSALGRIEEALATCERLHERLDAARARLYLGRIRLAQGRLDDAEAVLTKALEIGDDPHMRVFILAARAMAHHRKGRAAPARTTLQQALELCNKVNRPEDPTCGQLHVTRATIEAGSRGCGVARPHLEHGRQIVEKALGPDHPQLADALTLEGRCALRERRWAEAVAPLERALTLLETARLAPAKRGEPRSLLARALWEMGEQRPRALAAAAQAEAELVQGVPPDDDDLRALRAWRRTETAKTPRN